VTAPDRQPQARSPSTCSYSQQMARRDAAATLAEALLAVAPPEVKVGHRRISADDVAHLWNVEAAHVRQAVALRQREFASGRALLRELVGRPVAIPVGANREPVMPSGITASLAHDREFVIAAVSAQPNVLAIGIDVEPATPLETEVADVVLRPDEVGIDAHQAFTMKEAAYKAWSALGGRMLDHHDVRLSVDGLAFRAEVIPDGTSFDGHSIAAADRWISLVVEFDAERSYVADVRARVTNALRSLRIDDETGADHSRLR
jgi:4'-phosphopantetheinyl transferase EntD